jgi:predicted transcriptional regulator
VLIHVAQQPRITARELSSTIGVTERATLRILNELIDEGYITKAREGRNNRYRIIPEQAISSRGLNDLAVEAFLKMLGWKKRGRPRKVA